VTFEDLASGTATKTTGMLWTDPLDIKLAGLPPHTDVTVRARFVGWGSESVFTSAADGTLDLATAAPKSGSYVGADADGVVWSMTPGTSSADKGQDQFALRVTANIGDTEIATGSLARYAGLKSAPCKSVNENGLVGYYCAPTNGPVRGGIVAFGGSEGGLDTGQSLAMYYAALGYPTLGLAYFGAPGVPSELSQIPLEYFDKAFDWLEAQPQVQKGKLLVNGGSRGGELALLLGATFPRVTAVIANVPSGVLWGAPTADGKEVASWTFGGQPIAWVPYLAGSAKPVKESDGTMATAYAPEFLDSIHAASVDVVDAATSRVEQTHGPVMMLAGADDQVWAACALAQYAWVRLVSYGHTKTYADEFECYPNAGHNVTPFSVGLPTTNAAYAADQGETLALGGTPIGIAHAARDADNKVRAFLSKNL
jgi:dienelactone hydrolase